MWLCGRHGHWLLFYSLAQLAICSPADIWQEMELSQAELLDFDRVVGTGLGS